MIRADVLHALKAYTTLPSPVQGLLTRVDDHFEFGSGLTRDKTLEKVLKNIDVDVFCARRLRLLRGLSEPATVVEGPFVVRGKSVSLDDGTLGIVSVVSGKLPEAQQRDSNSYLVDLKQEDVMVCALPQQVPFGVNVVADSLAPRWNYVSAVFTKKVPSVFVACPNGVFSIKSSSAIQASRLTPSSAEELLKNAIELDLVVELQGEQPKTIYRIAKNCILAGGEHAKDAILSIQQTLKIPSPSVGKSTLPTMLTGFSIDESLLTPGDAVVSEQALKGACPPGATVRKESLKDWWRVPKMLSLRVRLVRGSPAADSGLDETTEAQQPPSASTVEVPFLSGDKAFDVAVRLQFPAFRELLPGENKALLTTQLKSLVAGTLERCLKPTRGSDMTQKLLDALTADFSQSLGADVNKSRLFDEDVAVVVSAHLDEALGGLPTTLPSGDVVSVPRYSFDYGSARLSAYLGIFSSLGLQGAFSNWEDAFKNKLLSV